MTVDSIVKTHDPLVRWIIDNQVNEAHSVKNIFKKVRMDHSYFF